MLSHVFCIVKTLKIQEFAEGLKTSVLNSKIIMKYHSLIPRIRVYPYVASSFEETVSICSPILNKSHLNRHPINKR